MLFFLLPNTIPEKRSSIFSASLFGKNFPPFLSGRLFKSVTQKRTIYLWILLISTFFSFWRRQNQMAQAQKECIFDWMKLNMDFSPKKIEFFAWKSNLIDHLGNPDLARGSFVKKRSDPAKIQQVCKQSHSTAKQVHFVPENQFCNALKTSLALQKL